MRVLKEKSDKKSELMEEYKLVAAMWKTYRVARGTLLVTAIAGIGILSNIYRDTVQTFRTTRLTETGISITEKVLPDIYSTVIASTVLIGLTVWVIFIDTYLENEQRICVERCETLGQNLFQDESFVLKIHQIAQRTNDPFLLGRGLLIVLSLAWISIYIGFSLFSK